MSHYTHGGHAPRDRYRKAHALAAELGDQDWSPRFVSRLAGPPDLRRPASGYLADEKKRQQLRRSLERAADVSRSSDETWALAGTLFRDRVNGRTVPAPEQAQFCTRGHYIDADTLACRCEDLDEPDPPDTS